MNTPSLDEKLEGRDRRSLADVLAREGPMPARRVARIAAQVLEALSKAHDRGAAHGALEPASILVGTSPGEPEVAEVIGLDAARTAGAAPPDAAAGSSSYVAPERLRGDPATPRSDLYALGLIMAEALSGEAVVGGPGTGSIRATHLDDEPLPLPREVLGSPLGEVIRRAVEKDPEWRFSGAEEMLAVLERTPFEPGDDPWRSAETAGEAPAAAPAGAGATGGEAPAQKRGGRVAPFVKLVAIVVGFLVLLFAVIEIGRYAIRPNAPEPTPPAPVVLDPPEVDGLRGATSDQIRAAILAAGWEIANDSAYEIPGIQARTFEVRRGEDRATVYWNEHRNRGVPLRLVRNMREAPTTATARQAGTLVYVFHPYQMDIAQELLAAILAQHRMRGAGGDGGPDANRTPDAIPPRDRARD